MGPAVKRASAPTIATMTAKTANDVKMSMVCFPFYMKYTPLGAGSKRKVKKPINGVSTVAATVLIMRPG